MVKTDKNDPPPSRRQRDFGEASQENQNKVEELTNLWKRALADYQNLEKRHEKEKSDLVRFASASLILKFLPIFRHLEKAAESLKDKGLDLVVNEFKIILNEEGIEEIKSLGENFNPQLMEAVDIIKGEEKNENMVAEVVEKGYRLNGKVLLPPKVKVFKAEIPSEKTEN